MCSGGPEIRVFPNSRGMMHFVVKHNGAANPGFSGRVPGRLVATEYLLSGCHIDQYGQASPGWGGAEKKDAEG